MSDDVTDRARAALENTNCTDDMQDFFQVGLVRELLAEVKSLRAELALSRDGIQVRPMTETESNLMTQVLDLRRERAEARAEVERLRGCPHDSWSGDGTGRWRCDECDADQGSQDVGEIRQRLAAANAEVERLRGALRGDQ